MAYIDINDTTGTSGGTATAANQLTEIALLTSIDNKEPTLGQKPMSGSEPVVIASDQSTVPVADLTGKLVPEIYDEIDLTYVVSGNGIGQIQTAVYKSLTLTVATLTLTYDIDNRISTIVRT
jgi:hypothetical protein